MRGQLNGRGVQLGSGRHAHPLSEKCAGPGVLRAPGQPGFCPADEAFAAFSRTSWRTVSTACTTMTFSLWWTEQ